MIARLVGGSLFVSLVWVWLVCLGFFFPHTLRALLLALEDKFVTSIRRHIKRGSAQTLTKVKFSTLLFTFTNRDITV